MNLKELMRSLGLVGAGGAGFPSFAKIAEGANTLLINGSECEPLLYTDFMILREELETVLLGINAVLDGAGIPRAVLAVKKHTADALGFTDGESLGGKITVKALPDAYPIGDEVGLIYETLGRVVRPGNLPISQGVIVYNTETMFNLGRGVKYGEGVTEKWLTVGGAIDSPSVVRVPVGVRVCDLFKKLGIAVKDGFTVLDGGPSMGKIINYHTAVVTKTTKALLILPDNTPAVQMKKMNPNLATARAETACCGCSRCTDMCPRHLLGYPLEPHKMVRTAMGAIKASPAMVLNASLCCGCGICESLACSQGISPKAVINNYKVILAENKLKYIANADVSVKAERSYRMVPSSRWASTLGVKKFDTPPTYLGKISDFTRVEIPLRPNIGAPSDALVKDTERVLRGALIASPKDGLSIAQHASIDGRVYATGEKIIIDKVN